MNLGNGQRGCVGPSCKSLCSFGATYLVGENVDVKTAQDHFGHRKSATTLEIYAESVPAHEREVARTMDSFVKAALGGRAPQEQSLETFHEAVLGMLELCPTNPAYLYVATPHRVRKGLPGYIRLVHTPGETGAAVYDGIPCQHVSEAILAAQASVMRDRLEEAAEKARREGYLLADDVREIARKLEAGA